MNTDVLVAGLLQLASIERPQTDEDFTPDIAWELITEYKEVMHIAALAIAILTSKLEVAQADLRALEDAVRTVDDLHGSSFASL